ncbi:MAG: insulinase family protein [Flammeovirgaceae bacterium]|nr:MAG: insulinase family protein [Flammeovirgaceae bacterium]
MENELFRMYYLLDAGSNNDPRLRVAIEYLEFLGTDKLSAEQLKKELYKLGCDFSVFASTEQTYIMLEGLSENMEKAIVIMEDLLKYAKPDEDALRNLKDDILKKREDAKKDRYAIFYEGLMNYGKYGPISPFTNVLTNDVLQDISSEELVSIIRDFTTMNHIILYYGPKKEDELTAILKKHHQLPDQLNEVPASRIFTLQDVIKPTVYWTHYDMVQTDALFIMKAAKYDKNRIPAAELFSTFISTQVFRELREAQGLAYSTYAYYVTPQKSQDYDVIYGYVGTQADKQVESLSALKNILYNLPETEDGFKEARESLLKRIESQRIIKQSVLFNYLSAQKLGLDYDIRRDVYNQIQSLTLSDLLKFHAENIKNKKYNLVLIGNREKINFKDLARYGEVKEVSLDELFGYKRTE